ncbi:MAG TPA: HDIG domain-containing protein [candidate division Zixibacteria bacterium]|nr:HDIG domain-containing protein [candidate division Zixibacteria bacterium]
MEKIWKELSIVEKISDDGLRARVRETFETAIVRGGWTEEQALEIPFTLLIPDVPVTLVEHTKAVAEMALANAEFMASSYENYDFDRDVLIAGGILHDAGKFLEYKIIDGRYVKSEVGKFLRHPFSGCALAFEMGLPPAICHCIAVHAGEGDGGWRSIEAIAINKADFTNFHSLKEIAERNRR